MAYGKAPLHAELSTKVVDALAETLQRIQRVLQPSDMPGREHYLFSLRHVIVAIQSLRLVDGQTRNEANFLAPFLKHELNRIIHDQLVREIDQFWFKDTLDEIFHHVSVTFSLSSSSLVHCRRLDISMGEEEEQQQRRGTSVFHLSVGRKKLRTSIEFSDDQRDQSKDDERTNELSSLVSLSLKTQIQPVESLSQLRKSIDQVAMRYREEFGHHTFSLAVSENSALHIIRMHRILSHSAL
jgi:hypothetical protein